MLGMALWASWVAWSTAAPLGDGLTPRESPQEFVLLTCSLLCFYGAAMIGGWLLSRTRAVGKRLPFMLLPSVVTGYGLIAAVVFALSTASAWSLAAVLPLALMAYMHVNLRRSAPGKADSASGDMHSAAGTATV